MDFGVGMHEFPKFELLDDPLENSHLLVGKFRKRTLAFRKMGRQA